jgi:hypothetical protein
MKDMEKEDTNPVNDESEDSDQKNIIDEQFLKTFEKEIMREEEEFVNKIKKDQSKEDESVRQKIENVITGNYDAPKAKNTVLFKTVKEKSVPNTKINFAFTNKHRRERCCLTPEINLTKDKIVAYMNKTYRNKKVYLSFYFNTFIEIFTKSFCDNLNSILFRSQEPTQVLLSLVLNLNDTHDGDIYANPQMFKEIICDRLKYARLAISKQRFTTFEDYAIELCGYIGENSGSIEKMSMFRFENLTILYNMIFDFFKKHPDHDKFLSKNIITNTIKFIKTKTKQVKTKVNATTKKITITHIITFIQMLIVLYLIYRMK